MRKLLTILLLGLSSLALAQEMSVKSFYLAETDLTANTPGTMVHDQNGNVCALIKIETPLDGFSFDVGSLGVSEVKRVGGEIWVYVPYGIRKITLSHQQLGVIRDYQIPCSIEKGRTYVMTLIAGTVRTIVEHAVSKQFLLIELEPKDAILEINGKIKVTNSGIFQELLPFGKWQYKAYCQNYHDLVGVVEISDPNNTHSLSLKLKPAFGHISFLDSAQPEITGAAVYIDEKYIGEIPLNDIQINSGSHRIRIIKEMYEAYNETFIIADEERKQITPYLKPDFAEVTLRTIERADIFINGERKGNQSWSGKLPCGSYIFETRKKGHVAYKTTYEISRKDHSRTISIDGPTPIYGSLGISSTPAKAKVYIDGEYVGETPKYISKQVIGDYSVKVELPGYEVQTNTINIQEGKESSLSFSLNKSVSKTYQSQTSSSIISIKIGESVKLNAPSKVTFWESDSPTKAKVDDNGIVTGISKGKVTLWAHLANGDLKMYSVNVLSSSTSYSNTNVSPSVTVAETAAKSTNARTITSTDATIRVGEQIFAKLPLGYVDKWDTKYTAEYVRANSDGSLVALKEGKIGIWGYVNSTPKIFTLTIVNHNKRATSRQSSNNTYKKEFVVPKDARIIYSKEATIKIGEKVVAKLPEGYIDSWDEQYAKEYINFNSDGSIVAIKRGKIGLWGYINGSPKIFTLTIVK